MAKNLELIQGEEDTETWKEELLQISHVSLLPKSKIKIGLKMIREKILESTHNDSKEKWECFFELFETHFLYEVGQEAISLFQNLHSIYRVIERHEDKSRKGLKKLKIKDPERKICCKQFFSKSY